MADIRENVAYLKGLKDGMQLEDANTVKLLDAILNTFESIADRIDDVDDFADEIAETVDMIGDELDEVEDFLDDTFMDDECDCCDDDCDCCDWDDDECDCCDDDCDCDCDDYIEIACPYCKQNVAFDTYEFSIGAELRCPNCGEVVFPEED